MVGAMVSASSLKFEVQGSKFEVRSSKFDPACGERRLIVSGGIGFVVKEEAVRAFPKKGRSSKPSKIRLMMTIGLVHVKGYWRVASKIMPQAPLSALSDKK